MHPLIFNTPFSTEVTVPACDRSFPPMLLRLRQQGLAYNIPFLYFNMEVGVICTNAKVA